MDIQARLYYRIIRNNLDRDEYFKDFELLDYKFIVVNKQNLNPLIWSFSTTKDKGTINFNNKIILRDPEDIAIELNKYLKEGYSKPTIKNDNNLVEWLNKI